MKIALTLLIQKEIEAASDDDADAKVTAIKQQFERAGWSVSIEDDSQVDGDEEE